MQRLLQKRKNERETFQISINNTSTQLDQSSLLELSAWRLVNAFNVNIFAMLYTSKPGLLHLAMIVKCASSIHYVWHPKPLCHSFISCTSIKGAIVAFTRSMEGHLPDKGIQANLVDPGRIVT